jgi:hypothetical protein
VEDVVALGQLQARYADVVTRRAWPELAGLFLADASIHLDTVTNPPRQLVGPDELGVFIGTAIERFDYFAFVILNAVVDVDSDATATGRMFICEIRHEAAAGTWHNAYGVYQDRYRKVDGRWWFAERSYRSMARTGEPSALARNWWWPRCEPLT